LLQYEIATTVDIAVRLYREDTAEEDQTNDGVLAAMRLGTLEKTSLLMKKLGKLTTVANPALGKEWLDEVL